MQENFPSKSSDACLHEICFILFKIETPSSLLPYQDHLYTFEVIKMQFIMCFLWSQGQECLRVKGSHTSHGQNICLQHPDSSNNFILIRHRHYSRTLVEELHLPLSPGFGEHAKQGFQTCLQGHFMSGT